MLRLFPTSQPESPNKKLSHAARGNNPAAATRASRSKVWPAVSKSANFCPGLHQLELLLVGFGLEVFGCFRRGEEWAYEHWGI